LDPSLNGARISGLGVALPEREVSSAELGLRLGLSEQWIVSRTGIGSRHFSSSAEDVVTLGAMAAERALESAAVDAEGLEAVVCATITAPRRFPAVGCLIGSSLGTQAPAWDLNAGCSGFLFALAQADALVRSGSARRVLVVGTDVMSKITDQDDPKTAILFGDGAGAVVVEASAGHDLGPFQLHSDGARPELLYTDQRDLIRMNGREVFRAAVEAMCSAVTSLLEAAGLGTDEMDLLVAHQANQRILDAVIRRLGIEPSRVVSNIAEKGNTSAASIPLALSDALGQGRLNAGDLVVLTAFGAGFCWGAGLMRWGVTSVDQPTLVGAAHV
jgi:3-oxoacyl-[acyl-carrier-protein] synthase-3